MKNIEERAKKLTDKEFNKTWNEGDGGTRQAGLQYQAIYKRKLKQLSVKT